MTPSSAPDDVSKRRSTDEGGSPTRRPARIRNESSYQAVATHIRREVSLGRLLPGDRLPPERQFSADLGVSRETLRQALRVLEGSGHLEVRRGARGGAFIRDATRNPDAQLVELEQRSDFFRQLLEFRQVIETAAAGKAAALRTDHDLAVMAGAQQALLTAGTKEESRRADTQFHLAVAGATGNEVLRASIEEARAQMFLPIDLLHFDFVTSSSHKAHADILAAVVAQDAERARLAMSKHLATTRTELERVLQAHQRA